MRLSPTVLPMLRLSAFQAARHRVWKTRLSKVVGILTVSPGFRDIDKSGGSQSTRRTAAMASLKVGSCLGYQAAAFGCNRVVLSRARASAQTVISETIPSRAGVVRRIARSDHWRCVSTPRCARTSWDVVSTRQRETNQPRINAGVAPRSVLRNAEGSCSQDGSRTSTQRIEARRASMCHEASAALGTGGMPAWYQTAVPVATNNVRCCALYHWETTRLLQTVFLLARRALRV